MRIRRRAWAALLAAVAFAAACGNPGDDQEPLAGVVLPSLRVTDLEGATASVDAYGGRILVLNVWATWCAPCRKELPSLDRLSARLDATRFVVAGVAVDADPVAVREFLLQNAVRFPNLVAVDRQALQRALATHTFPQTLIFAADGSFIERIDGPRNWDSPASIARIEAASLRSRGPAAGLAPAAGDRLSLVAAATLAEGRTRGISGNEGSPTRERRRTGG